MNRTLITSALSLLMAPSMAFAERSKCEALFTKSGSIVSSGYSTSFHFQVGATSVQKPSAYRTDVMKPMVDHPTVVQNENLMIKAAESGDLNSLRALLDAGVNPNAKLSNGTTALHFAGHKGEDHLVRLLISRGADPTAKDSAGRTPMDYTRRGITKDFMTKAATDPNYHRLLAHELKVEDYFNAVSKNQIAKVEKLLKEGLKVDEPRSLGITPLVDAARLGNIEMVSFLISHGANVNWSVDSTSPLLMAIEYKNQAIVELLLNKHADPNIVGSQGNTALHLAVSSNVSGIVASLLKFGAQLEIRNNTGRTPFAMSSDLAMLQFLASRGANVNAENIEGLTQLELLSIWIEKNPHSSQEVPPETIAWLRTVRDDQRYPRTKFDLRLATVGQKQAALDNAIIANDVAAIKSILATGFPVEGVAFNGFQTPPLHTAVANGKTKAFEALLAAGADIQSLDSSTGNTVLHTAAYYNSMPMAKRLVKMGLKLDAVNETGFTPAELAWDRGNEAMRDYLESLPQ